MPSQQERFAADGSSQPSARREKRDPHDLQQVLLLIAELQRTATQSGVQ